MDPVLPDIGLIARFLLGLDVVALELFVRPPGDALLRGPWTPGTTGRNANYGISGSAASDAPTRRPFAIHTDILLERRSHSNVGRGKEIPTCLVVVLVIRLPLGSHVPIDLIDFANLKCTSIAHRCEDHFAIALHP